MTGGLEWFLCGQIRLHAASHSQDAEVVVIELLAILSSGGGSGIFHPNSAQSNISKIQDLSI